MPPEDQVQLARRKPWRARECAASVVTAENFDPTGIVDPVERR